MPVPKLDHIILLIPHSSLSSIPGPLTSAFTISPGGRHADGLTENKLIILADGVYIELIAFVDDAPDRKHGHWWGSLPNGIIDFALTSSTSADVQPVRDALGKAGLPVTYAPARDGGRTRPDGVEVKWQVTFPEATKEHVKLRRGQVPFWCHDVTERELRVPRSKKEAVTHPSGTLGVKELRLGVPKGKVDEFMKEFRAITGVDGGEAGKFRIGTPFGEECVVVIEPFDDDSARVLGLKMRTDQDDVKGIDEAFGGGNTVKIDFVR